jgi:hypothetical protein
MAAQEAVDPFADSVEEVKPSSKSKTAAEKRAAELEAQLKDEEAYQAPVDESGRPVPESQLTPDQKRIRDLEDQLARKQAARLTTAEDTLADKEDGDTLLIHFLEDGFTACGRVWYRGQELEFTIGSKAFIEQKDRAGRSWLELDDSDQMRKFGRVYFRRGPWPGKEWEDEAAAKAERKRASRPPLLPAVR